MTNEELVTKAITSASALAAAGKLNPEQSNQFLDFVIDVTELRGNVRTVRFRNESMEIDKIGVGGRVTVPAEEAKDPAIRRGVTTSKVTLTPVKLMTPFEISTEFGEHNIEGESVDDTVVRMMATQTGNDIEELMINGDTNGHARLESDLKAGGDTANYIKDSLMAKFNGWLRLCDSGNIHDNAGNNIGLSAFSAMLKKMPVKFRRTRRDLRFLVAMDLEQTWREKVASRATAQGDASLQGNQPVPVFGVPVVPVPLLEAEPLVVEHLTIGADPSSVSLRYAPVSDVVVHLQTLAQVPTAALVLTTDYTVDLSTGELSTVNGGALDGGGAIKVTYRSKAQVILANYQNLIMAIGRDITIKTAEDIYADTAQFAITTKVACQIEEVTATVKGINIGVN